jgi:hypothetical protein
MLANMRQRLKQLTAVTALVLVAGGSLVACSDDNDPKTDGVGGTADGTLTQANFFDEVIQAQAKAGTSHVEMSTNVAGQDVTSEGDVGIGKTPADTAMAMTMKTGQGGLGSIEMRLVDEIFYLNFGPMTKNKFAKIDLNDKNNPIGKQYGELVGHLDPASQFKQLEGAVSKFDQKGEAITLDGVKARPYEIVVDTSKLSAKEKAAGNALPKTLEYTMYVGPDNLPRRVTSKLPGAAGGGTMTIDYSKWGEEVSITKPKASEITDKDLLGQLGGATPQGS